MRLELTPEEFEIVKAAVAMHATVGLDVVLRLSGGDKDLDGARARYLERIRPIMKLRDSLHGIAPGDLEQGSEEPSREYRKIWRARARELRIDVAHRHGYHVAMGITRSTTHLQNPVTQYMYEGGVADSRGRRTAMWIGLASDADGAQCWVVDREHKK